MSFEEHTDYLMENEWSHFIESERVSEKPWVIELVLGDEAKPALVKRLGLHGIDNMKAELRLQRQQVNKVIHITGRITANLQQKCVVSMEPVEEHVEDEFEAWYAEPNQAVSFTKARRERMSAKEQEEQPILEEFDDPEPVIDGKIDLGELVTQYLSLALNPYPRAEGVDYKAEASLEVAEEGTYDNPFAALKDWKEREKKKDQ